MSGTFPKTVKIVEVGPRDGLQNEPGEIPTEQKIAFINQLSKTGLKHIEITSFVHPKAVPQLADAMDVVQGIENQPGIAYSALVPNMKGLERAIEAGVKRVAVFTAASNSFTQKNINMSIKDSLDAFRPVVERATAEGITVRGYVSTVVVCPYEGEVSPLAVTDVSEQLLAMGVDEISLGDTIGAAAPTDVHKLLSYILESIPLEKVALHFHDTYGTAIANVVAGLENGVAIFDASAGGLGGCPYAPGASGNLATEDLLYLMQRMNIKTDVDMDAVAKASMMMSSALGKPLPSKQLQRLMKQQATCM